MFSRLAAAAAASATLVQGASLASVCTTSHVTASLPSDDFIDGVTIDPSSVVVGAVYNFSISDSDFIPNGVINFCDVTFAYSHNGRDDSVLVNYWLPAPDAFQNRFLTTGGGGLAINSGNSSLPGGPIYGAAAGITDGGFGGFTNQFDTTFPTANGTANWDSLYMFGYQAIHEMTLLGQEFTKLFFGMNGTKLYRYYQACSEGGREGHSQIQRFQEFDGAITGAPAFRFSFQQVQHLYSNVVEKTLGYYPSPCELEKINNATIEACDILDGKKDGVVSRTDLCKLHFDLSSIIGESYYCAAAPATTRPAAPATPAVNGTVTAKAVEVAKEINNGLHDSEGRRVYFSYQPSSYFTDAETQYNSATGEWELDISGLGGEYITRFLQLQNTSDLTTEEFQNVTYDTLKEWIIEGWQLYEDSLQTNWPDLSPYQVSGAKILHFHGESDFSIPTASSVRYWESVRQIMYPGKSYNESAAALNEWYRLFLIPGAGHCAPNVYEPNGPFPQTNLGVLIDWVEKGVYPTTLNATYLAGDDLGDNAQICGWPLRPLWSNGTMTCEYDQTSLNTWHYEFDAIKMPVY